MDLDIQIVKALKAYLASGVEDQVDFSEVLPLLYCDPFYGY